ncbi:hypothetical protein ILUMI_20087, partial [Ignelater luminosus]
MAVIHNYMVFLYITTIIIASGETFKTINTPSVFSKSIGRYLQDENANKSKACAASLNKVSKGILDEILWTIQMFDAAGKLPPGILRGNGGDLGAFDECMAIKSAGTQKTIFGKYCLGTINNNIAYLNHNESFWTVYSDYNTVETKSTILNKLPSLKFGACLPHTCSANDFEQFYKSLNINMIFSENNCQSSASPVELDGIAIGTLVLLGFVLAIIIVSTLYDVYNHYIYKEEKTLSPLLTAFSAFTNGRKLLKTNSNSNQISCIHGIRVITMMWIILGHRVKVTVFEVMLFNKADLPD